MEHEATKALDHEATKMLDHEATEMHEITKRENAKGFVVS